MTTETSSGGLPLGKRTRSTRPTASPSRVFAVIGKAEDVVATPRLTVADTRAADS